MQHFNTEAYVKNLAPVQREFDYREAMESGRWEEWRARFRARLGDALGLPSIRAAADSRLPLSPRIAERATFETHVREKIYITTESGIEIALYLFLPAGAGAGSGAPLPLVIAPHGHARRGKEIYAGNYENAEEEQRALQREADLARQALEAGFAVMTPDTRGFYEMARAEDYAAGRRDSCPDLQRKAFMYGRTLIGERVHDIGRLIDYAATRPEIDSGHVVVTGNSGGGTATLFAAAMDERISVAMPSSYFCTFADSIIAIEHCVCNVVPGIMRLGEMYDVAGLIAPRPVLMIHGEEDEIFPIEATRRAFDHLKNIYRGQGVPERCELYVGNGGHHYYKERAWSFAKEWLRQ